MRHLALIGAVLGVSLRGQTSHLREVTLGLISFEQTLILCKEANPNAKKLSLYVGANSKGLRELTPVLILYKGANLKLRELIDLNELILVP